MEILSLLQYFLVLNSIIAFIVGIVFVNLGYKKSKEGNRNLGFLRLGWILIGVSNVILSICLFFYFANNGFYSFFGILILLSPLIIVLVLILTAALGACYLVNGYNSKPRDLKIIKRGWILFIINWTVLTSIIVLLLMFMSGIITIRLM